MADELDKASERESEEREYRIAEARRVIPIHPVLDCLDCKGIDQDTAKLFCEDYGNCLADWERIERAKKIRGNVG